MPIFLAAEPGVVEACELCFSTSVEARNECCSATMEPTATRSVRAMSVTHKSCGVVVRKSLADGGGVFKLLTPHFQLEVQVGVPELKRVGQNNLPSVLRVFHRGRS